jgi:hypothetical protein
MSSVTCGKERPFCTTDTSDRCLSQNRRGRDGQVTARNAWQVQFVTACLRWLGILVRRGNNDEHRRRKGDGRTGRLEGVEFLTTGRLALPIPDPLGAHLRNVRTGRVPLAEVLAEAEAVETALKSLLETSPLPEHPDVERVEAFLIRAYRERWGW